jgi:hypothetical protein
VSDRYKTEGDRITVPDLFTLPELEAYAADDWDPVRAPTIHALTLGTVYGLIPEAVADTSVRAKAIGLEAAKRAMELYDSESVDDYTMRRRNGSTRAGVHLTDDERAELLSVAAAASGSSRSRVRSVRLRSWGGPV